ncbi:MAG TPA: heterodisulfide reductase-related iron-sulfur binding cluster [Vicinamibacterales bacterium]|nr:heterodisulfide reductase-related iron-sulfur binding cluster [Vicinamibacterales bacterium]
MNETPLPAWASVAPLDPLIDKCVHCGFCLPTCPSYLLLGQEMDSPRGRIYMMKAGVEGRLPMTAAVVDHFDTCLGCMACETACPSGVRYAPLVEETRAAIEHHHRRSASDTIFRNLLFQVLPYPARLRLLAGPLALAHAIKRVPALLAVLPPRLQNLLALAPGAARPGVIPERTHAQGATRKRVGLVTGCVQQVFFGDVNEATARTLAAEGCDVLAPRSQGCCGALALHAGQDNDARTFAKHLIAAFEDATAVEGLDAVVINAAGCGSTMKQYGELLKDDPLWAERATVFASKVRDVTELLASLEPRAPRHPLEMRVAYHDACHLAHAQGIRKEPRTLLSQIPGVSIVPIGESEICCGSAGIFNLVQPEMAAELGKRKVANLVEANADIVATSNPGCILQISAAARASGQSVPPVVHIIQLVDASIRGTRV